MSLDLLTELEIRILDGVLGSSPLGPGAEGYEIGRRINKALTLAAQGGGGGFSGEVLGGAFSGSPAVADVVFGTPLDSAYRVDLTVHAGGNVYLPTVTSDDANGFTINLNSSRSDLVSKVTWEVMILGGAP